MAKNNNLTDFLTDVANAIREKKGSSDPINPQNFSDEIASIETGGGGGGVVGAVNFKDYDGTILHSFGKDEFLAMSEMPTLPTQRGLICQRWNYTLQDAQEYVAEYGVLDVGAAYITDDGKTRLYITIAAKGRQDVPLYFSQTVANGVIIDWGDGSAPETLSGTGNQNTIHHYNAIGNYVISLNVVDDCTLDLGHNNSSYCIMGSSGADGRVYCSMLQKAEIGKRVTSIGKYAFNNCHSLASVVIPQGVTAIGDYIFNNCYSLASVVIPQGVTSIGKSAFYNCYSLTSVVIPQGVTSIGNSVFYYCYSLTSVVIPQGVTSIGNSVFYYCYSLTSVVIPQGVTSIGNSVFQSCHSLASIVIPQGIKSIGSETFYSCYSLTSVVIPQSVTSIGSYAFNNCYSLASVVIPQGVTAIGDYAFRYCYSLASVVIPQGIKSIGSSVFEYCQSLASIEIPQSVTSIGAGAFRSCNGMAFYDFADHQVVPSLSATSAFVNIKSDCKIVVPDVLYDAWIAATNWSTYATYIVKASEFNA